MRYEEFVQEEPIDQVHAFDMVREVREENKALPDQAIYIIPSAQTPSQGASSSRPITQPMSTLTSSKPGSNMLNTERAGMMFYDELEHGSQH